MTIDRPESGMLGSFTTSSSALIHDVMDHTKQTWSHVTQGKASIGEYLEAGAEVMAGVATVAALGRFGISRFMGQGAAVAEKQGATLATERLVFTEPALTAKYFNNGELKAVDSVRGIVGRTKSLATRISDSALPNEITGGERGGVNNIAFRIGASGPEKAHQILSAGLLRGELFGAPFDAPMTVETRAAALAAEKETVGLMKRLMSQR